jgi:hypothetical protein
MCFLVSHHSLKVSRNPYHNVPGKLVSRPLLLAFQICEVKCQNELHGEQESFGNSKLPNRV